MPSFLPEGADHDAVILGAHTRAGIVVHTKVVAHLVGQRSTHSYDTRVVILRSTRNKIMSLAFYQLME